MNKIQRLADIMVAFNEARDWKQFHDPKNLAVSLNLEASEVLELFQWTQDNQLNPERSDKIGEELADVFYWLIMLAKHYDIDLIEALENKMAINEKKYPIEKAKGSAKKYTEF